MRVCVIDNAHIFEDSNLNKYSPSIYDNDFFMRFTSEFEQVRFLAKTKQVDKIDSTKMNHISINNLEIVKLPWFRGLKGLITNFFHLVYAIRNATNSCDIYIFRVAQIESFLGYIFRKNRKAVIVIEIVNDPKTYFRGIQKWFSVFMMKTMIRNADGVAYITKNVLQRIYPIVSKKQKKNVITSSYLTLDLEDSCFAQAPKKYPPKIDVLNIIHVANNIDSDSKGHSVLIKAAKRVIDAGYNVKVTFVGDGDKINYFKKMVEEYGMSSSVFFIGRIHDKNEIYSMFKEADLFVFPTKHEGLGRVNIEAQACGLPCLSSPVGGVVELLPQKYLIDPNDYEAYGDVIIRLIENPQELEDMSEQNLKNSIQFSASINKRLRAMFYKEMKAIVKQ